MATASKSTIALVAHDGKKHALLAFVKANAEFFRSFDLIATATTGKLLEDAGFTVTRLLSGPLGGDAQIAARVATGACAAVLFLRDPLGMHPHEPDIYTLLRICDVHDVPLATNLSTANLVVQQFRK